MALIVNYSPTFLMVSTGYVLPDFNFIKIIAQISPNNKFSVEMFIAVGYVYLLPISIIQTRMGVVLVVCKLFKLGDQLGNHVLTVVVTGPAGPGLVPQQCLQHLTQEQGGHCLR